MNHINEDFTTMESVNTKRYGTDVHIPTNNHVLTLIADEYDETDGKRKLQHSAVQKQNEYIKKIADSLEVPTKVCFQVGRRILAALLKRTSFKTSEKYVKIRDRPKKEEANHLESFLNIKENPTQ